MRNLGLSDGMKVEERFVVFTERSLGGGIEGTVESVVF